MTDAYITLIAGVVAACMHGTTLMARAGPLPMWRIVTAELLQSGLLGCCTAEVARRFGLNDIMPLLLVSGLLGATLGPKGLTWLLRLLMRVNPVLKGLDEVKKND